MVSDATRIKLIMHHLDEMHSRFISFQTRVDGTPQVSSSTIAFDFRNCPAVIPSGGQAYVSRLEYPDFVRNVFSVGRVEFSALEAYVDANLVSGRTVAWLLDVIWRDEEWEIQYSVAVNKLDRRGQVPLVEFPDRIMLTMEELITESRIAIAELLGTLDSAEVTNFIGGRTR